MPESGSEHAELEARQAAKEILRDLVARYERRRAAYVDPHSTYVEAQVRIDFLNPLLRLLGWDVHNAAGHPQHLREVLQEAPVEVDEDDELREKNPDYTLQVGGKRALFLEAKKPSVNIAGRRPPAFQIRRYGWSARLSFSLLSNFEHLAVYDTRHLPSQSDDPHVSRVMLLGYADYVDHFDELFDLFGRDSVYAGSVDALSERSGPAGVPFDHYFLRQIENWRINLAGAMLSNNEHFRLANIDYLVQRLINSVVFLRVCEGRDLETYEQLRAITSYEGLKELFEEADERYNSGLFAFVDSEIAAGLDLPSRTLIALFHDLYLPNSPYAFSVVEPGIIGEIYEFFLGKRLEWNGDGLQLVDKPEISASQGVVATPAYVTDNVVARTLGPLVNGKSPEDLRRFRVCDLACGSGSFLLSAYTLLLDHYLDWYLSRGEFDSDIAYEVQGNAYRLTLGEKIRILTRHVFGVDIDSDAVDVARFSLLLKLVEDETPEAIEAQQLHALGGALPKLDENVVRGNSLVDGRYFEFRPEALEDSEEFDSVYPTDFDHIFPRATGDGGFDAIVGNPPYVRIQRLAKYAPNELAYYRSERSGYSTARPGNIDKYFLFIERGLGLLKPTGRLGFIVQSRFMLLKAAAKLRRLISEGQHLSELTHFGIHQVFEGRLTYAAIVVLSRGPNDAFVVERVNDLPKWRLGLGMSRQTFPADYIGMAPWVFPGPAMRAVFDRVRAGRNRPLSAFAQVFVGLQTSADAVYMHKRDDIDEIYDVGSRRFTVPTIAVQVQDEGEWEVETDVLVPCVWDAELHPFASVEPNAVMIFPYRPGTRDEYLPEELKSDFPLAWTYLNAFRERLSGRDVRGGDERAWYRFGRTQNLDRFVDEDRLIWSTLATGSPYAVDRLNTRFTGGGNGPYYGLRLRDGADVSLYYLLAVLSHPVVEALVRYSAPEFQGSYYSHMKQYVENLPVFDVQLDRDDERAKHDRIVEVARSRIEVLDGLGAEAHTPAAEETFRAQDRALKAQLNLLVGELYGLGPSDIEALESDSALASFGDEA